MKQLTLGNSLKLNTQESNLLEAYVSAYSRDLSVSNLFSRIRNAIYGIFGKSDWQYAEELLENKALPLVKADFSCTNDSEEDLRLRAKKLSTFSLRYLVTAASHNAGHHQLYFTHAQIEEMEQMSQNDILEKSAYGNGMILGISPRNTLISNLQTTRNSLISEVNDFEDYLDNDPMIQQAKFLGNQIDQFVNSVKKPSHTSSNKTTNIPEEVTQSLTQARAVIKHANKFEDINFSKTHSIKALDSALSNLSKCTEAFKKVVAISKAPVKGFWF